MITLKILDQMKAKLALGMAGPEVKMGQKVFISSKEFAHKLTTEFPGAFEIMVDQNVELEKEMHPKSNKMLTKAKASKYKSK